MKTYFLPVFLLWCAACHSSAIFEKYEELPEETWSRYNILEFRTAIPDSGLYHITLCLRHTTDYEMANLWCFLSTRSRARQELKDTVNLKIAEPDGRWLGRGNHLKTLEQTIHKNPVYLPKGEIIFRLEQGMRMEEMKGVKDVGIRITKAKEDEKQR